MMEHFPDGGVRTGVFLLGKGNTVSVEALREQALAGAGGYKRPR